MQINGIASEFPAHRRIMSDTNKGQEMRRSHLSKILSPHTL